jgi:putative YhbY family RNA-binding protein
MQGLWEFLGSGRELPRQNKIGVWNHRINYMLGMWGQKEISNSEGTPFEKKKLRRLKSQSRKTEPTVWIGKEGASEALVSQIENQLKSRELVKVKIQRSALSEVEASDLAAKVASSTSSTLVEVMGHTFTVYKKHENPIAQRKTETRSREKFRL